MQKRERLIWVDVHFVLRFSVFPFDQDAAHSSRADMDRIRWKCAAIEYGLEHANKLGGQIDDLGLWRGSAVTVPVLGKATHGCKLGDGSGHRW